MKIKLIILAILLPMLAITAATPKENVKADFTAYINHLINQEFKKSTEYLYPELFDFVPKEQMISTMDQTFNNSEIMISLSDPQVQSIGEVREIDSSFYCLLNYSHKMNMKFAVDTSNTKEDIVLRDELTFSNLKSNFGEDNVTYDSTNSSFDILSVKDSYAKSTNGTTDWKFIDIDKSKIMFLNALLPKEIVDEITAE